MVAPPDIRHPDLTLEDAALDLRGRRKNQRDLVLTSALERAGKFGQHVIHRTCCQDLDLSGVRRDRRCQCDDETDGCRDREPVLMTFCPVLSFCRNVPLRAA